MNRKIIPDEPQKTEGEEKRRIALMETVANHCKKLGNFLLASQYFIKLGQKEKAMKCLIK